MKVEIETSVRHYGNPKGIGMADATVIYIDQKGDRHERKVTADIKDSTKNALALKIATKALKVLIKPCDVALQIDNKYIKNCVNNGWLEEWQKRNWKKANGKDPANLELWKALYISLKIHHVTFVDKEKSEND